MKFAFMNKNNFSTIAVLAAVIGGTKTTHAAQQLRGGSNGIGDTGAEEGGGGGGGNPTTLLLSFDEFRHVLDTAHTNATMMTELSSSDEYIHFLETNGFVGASDISHEKAGVMPRIDEFKNTPLGAAISNVIGNTSPLGVVDATVSSSSDSNSMMESMKHYSNKGSVCDQLRLYAQTKLLLEAGIFIPYERIGDVCFDVTNSPNESCPFEYIPSVGFSNGDLDFMKKYYPTEFPYTRHAFDLFCECYAGYDLGCATKIPRTGDGFATDTSNSKNAEKDWAEYCKVAGAWNGEFSFGSLVSVKKQVLVCGCYFIAQAKEKVNECPGVNLGWKSAENPTASPTTTGPPISGSPTSGSPISGSPTSGSPISGSPTSESPISGSPTSESPISGSPTSESPISGSPISGSPISGSPTSGSPISGSPTSESPISGSPTSGPPISGSPTSESPISGSPTGPPMSGPPISGPPISGPPISGPPMSGPPISGPPMATSGFTKEDSTADAFQTTAPSF